MDRPATPLTLGRTLAGTGAWLIACTVVLFPVWPFLTSAQLRWVLLVVLGPPFYAWGSRLGGALLSSRLGHGIPARRISALRVLVALAVMLISYSLVVLGARLAGLAV